MEVEGTSEPPQRGSGSAPAKQKAERRRKAENSEKFNEILSACNQLSVAERTRLCKSLAGQLGLLTVGGQTLLHNPTESDHRKETKAKTSSEAAPVRPNPLKGTKFYVDKETAKAAMLKAREDAGLAKLPDTHATVVAYAKALKAYKSEQDKLKLVAAPTSVGGGTRSQGAKPSGKRNASKSPTRESLGSKALTGAKRLLGSSSGSKTESN